MPDPTHPRPCVCPYSRVRASAGQGLGIRSERPWALVRLNATTSPYHSFDRGRDAPSSIEACVLYGCTSFVLPKSPFGHYQNS